MLHVSSVAVYGPATRYSDDGAKTDERAGLRPIPRSAYYARSKRESEELVLSAHARGELWATAIRPSVVYGRRDRQFVPRIARLLSVGFAPVVGGGRAILSLVHAANVADGAVRAVATGEAGGQPYILANDFPLSVADFYRLAATGMRRRIRLVPVPMTVARTALLIIRAVGPIVAGSRMNVVSGSSSLDFITRDNPFSSERARRELGWRPEVTPQEGVPDAFHWWAAHR